MNISFTKKQQEYIAKQLKSGDFQNASEVVRDALRLHEAYRYKVISDLKASIEKGWNTKSSSKTIAEIVASSSKKAS